MAREEFVRDAARLIRLRPGLPSADPTLATWQQPPHPTVSAAQSAILPEETDVVIIGSGITGTSVAHALLNHPAGANLKIAMLEARGAVSGATGRNGGHLVSDSDSLFPALAQAFSVDMAAETARFSEANIRRLRALVAQLGPEDRENVEFRDLVTTCAFTDRDDLADAIDGVRKLREAAPDGAVACKDFGREESEKKFGYRNVAGTIQQEGVAALWPYRLLTAILASLLQEFPGRFVLETSTPVLSIRHDIEAATTASTPYSYRLETPRGKICARHIVHCTNGYAGQLIPGLVGGLYPLRGTMSAQDMGPRFPRVGDRMSWAHVSKGSYDAETGHVHLGLYYAQQNAKTGVMFLGGESQTLSGLLSSDDSVVGEDARRTLCAVPSKIWGDAAASSRPLQVWSGIMGFTGDGMPIVGKLPGSVTGRTSSDSEWIAAGYNGHGMDKAWLSGEAVARMLLGETEVPGFPRLYLLSEERIASWTPEKAAETLMHHVMLSDDHAHARSHL